MRPTTDVWVRLVLALLVVGGAACSGDDGSSDQAVPAAAAPPSDLDLRQARGDQAPLRPVRIGDLGETATALAAHPTEPFLLAARRSGAVFPVRLTRRDGFIVPELDPAPVLDLAGTVTTDGERGLLDLEFDPDGESLLASYTDPEGAVTLTRFGVDPGALTIDATDPEVVARLDHRFAGHNGGDLAWLDGDTVLWSLGDMDLTETDPPAAQDPATPLGSIVRLDLDRLPDRTLEASDLVGDRTVALGLRNPWRINVDEEAGLLLIGDVGDDTVEELDHLPLADLDDIATGRRPAPNFGWPHREGTLVTDRSPPRGTAFVDPLLERQHADDVCGITAGVTVDEEWAPAVAGRFLIGDLCSSEILAVDLGTGDTSLATAVDDGVVAFDLGATGEVYALGISGRLWRLDPAGWVVADAPDVAVPPPPSDEPATDLRPGEQQAVCDVRRSFDLLGQVPGSSPAAYRRLLRQARALFDGAVAGLPSELETAPLLLVLDEAARVGRTSGWDTSSTAFRDLFDAVAAADPPFTDFPDAISTVTDLGPQC